jgi:hypothetical protein
MDGCRWNAVPERQLMISVGVVREASLEWTDLQCNTRVLQVGIIEAGPPSAVRDGTYLIKDLPGACSVSSESGQEVACVHEGKADHAQLAPVLRSVLFQSLRQIKVINSTGPGGSPAGVGGQTLSGIPSIYTGFTKRYSCPQGSTINGKREP